MGGWVALFDANEWNNFLFNENSSEVLGSVKFYS
jgi:hypothetical protein